MKIGELVEILIGIRDNAALTDAENEAICAACNILDKLPRMGDAYEISHNSFLPILK